MAKKIKKAVFPVGGLGTRFLPATKSLPKEMLPVVDKPLIQYAFEEAVEAGITEFIFVTGRNKSAINDHFDHAFELQSVLDNHAKEEQLKLTRDWLPEAGSIAFVRQQDPLGLGHAVYCARHFIQDEPFVVLLADEMFASGGGFLKEMIEAHEDTGGNIIAVDEVPKEQVGQYGIIEGVEEGDLIKIEGMVEKPTPQEAPSNMAIVGRYILQPEIFSYLTNLKKGSGGEIQLTDAMVQMMADASFFAKRFTGKRFDCGSKLGFLEANIAMSLEDSSRKVSVLEILKRYIEA